MLKNLDPLLDGEILKYEKDWTLLGDKTPTKEIEMAGKVRAPVPPTEGAPNGAKKDSVGAPSGGNSRD
jgi:hypothetical protein